MLELSFKVGELCLDEAVFLKRNNVYIQSLVSPLFPPMASIKSCGVYLRVLLSYHIGYSWVFYLKTHGIMIGSRCCHPVNMVQFIPRARMLLIENTLGWSLSYLQGHRLWITLIAIPNLNFGLSLSFLSTRRHILSVPKNAYLFASIKSPNLETLHYWGQVWPYVRSCWSAFCGISSDKRRWAVNANEMKTEHLYTEVATYPLCVRWSSWSKRSNDVLDICLYQIGTTMPVYGFVSKNVGYTRFTLGPLQE